MRVRIVHLDEDIEEIYTVVDVRRLDDTYILRISFASDNRIYYGSIKADRKYRDKIDHLFIEGYVTFLADEVTVFRSANLGG